MMDLLSRVFPDAGQTQIEPRLPVSHHDEACAVAWRVEWGL
jgi:hypothetical protein